MSFFVNFDVTIQHTHTFLSFIVIYIALSCKIIRFHFQHKNSQKIFRCLYKKTVCWGILVHCLFFFLLFCLNRNRTIKMSEKKLGMIEIFFEWLTQGMFDVFFCDFISFFLNFFYLFFYFRPHNHHPLISGPKNTTLVTVIHTSDTFQSLYLVLVFFFWHMTTIIIIIFIGKFL